MAPSHLYEGQNSLGDGCTACCWGCAPSQLTSPSCPLPRSPGWALGVPKFPTGSGSAGEAAERGTGRPPPGLDRAVCGSWRPAVRWRGEPGAGGVQCEPTVLSHGGSGVLLPCCSPWQAQWAHGAAHGSSPATCQLPFPCVLPSPRRLSTSSLTSTKHTWSTPFPWMGVSPWSLPRPHPAG